MYCLSRDYGLDKPLCLINSLFILNIFNIITFHGSPEFLNIAFLPWVLFLLNRVKQEDKKNYFFLIPIILALIIYSGGPYTFIMAVMIIGYDAFVYSLKQKSIQPVINLLKIILFAFLLGGIKIIPMIELLHRFPRQIKLEAMPALLSFQNIHKSFMQIKYFFFSNENLYILKRPFFYEEISGYSFPPAAVFLLVSSFFMLWKRHKAFVILNMLFIFLALGDNSPVNVWRMLRFLPFWDWLRRPLKFFCVVIPLWSLSLGLTLREIYSRFSKLKDNSRIINTGIIFSVCFSVFICAGEIPKKWEKNKNWYDLRDSKKEFYQAPGENKKMFEAIFNNRGFLYNMDDSIGEQIRTKALPRGHGNYRGEYFLLNGFGKVKQDFFSPNRLKFNVEADKDDILVINQNYFPGWHSTVGKVINQNGLIGVPVAEKDKEITVYYLPASFIIGLTIFLGLICMTIFKRCYKRVKNIKG